MTGTKAGGLKAAATNKAKHGPDFYAEIGRKGGQNGHTGGFAANNALARVAGAKGGRKSRRGPSQKPIIVKVGTYKCIVCGKEFETTTYRHSRLICSQECERRRKSDQQRESRAARRVLTK